MSSPGVKTIAALVFCLVLSACASDLGNRPATADTPFLVGKTTKAEVLKALGLPQEISKDPSGVVHYWYDPSVRMAQVCMLCVSPDISKGSAYTKLNRAKLTFDATGVLIDFLPQQENSRKGN